MLNNDRSYLELKKGTNNFGRESGSRINEEKTEVLVRGDFEEIPQHLIKSLQKFLDVILEKMQTLKTTYQGYKKWKLQLRNGNFSEFIFIKKSYS